MSSQECYENYLKTYLKHATNVAILLDYDGTLTPIVAHPDMAKIPEETKRTLGELSEVPELFLAVISGRKAVDVKKLVGIDTITYAGNHGLEVLYPDGSSYEHKLPGNFDEQVREMIDRLEKEVVRDGAWIENKGASLTFHFRNVPENLQPEVERKAKDIIEAADFKAGKAHRAIEARPKVDWNKGKVALMLLDRKYGGNWWQKARVVFAGDDTTDEDAMEALKGHAATFRIAQSPDVVTHAEVKISSTADVVNILRIIKRTFCK